MKHYVRLIVAGSQQQKGRSKYCIGPADRITLKISTQADAERHDDAASVYNSND